MAPTQASSTPTSVARSSPDRLRSISRLRRVAGSSTSTASGACTRRPRKCGSAANCVSCAYCSSAPAAPTASTIPAQPKPVRSCTPNCSHNRRCALCTSNCHGGRAVTLQGPSGTAGSPSAASSSAGARRASSAASAASPASSPTVKRPLASSSTANPARPPWRSTAAIRLSRRWSSSASSVKVPGVTTRTSSRCIGPRPSGTPTCSQMATVRPRRTSRPR